MLCSICRARPLRRQKCLNNHSTALNADIDLELLIFDAEYAEGNGVRGEWSAIADFNKAKIGSCLPKGVVKTPVWQKV